MRTSLFCAPVFCAPIICALVAASCAASHTDEKPLVEPRQIDQARAAQPAPSDPAQRVQAGTSGVIARAELNLVLASSPGAFLQHVDPEPRFQSGRFAGWRLAAFFPGDARFAGVDLHAGDVVRRVNGNPVERPEQLMQVWQELRTSKELIVDVERDGRPRTLRWTIAP